MPEENLEQKLRDLISNKVPYQGEAHSKDFEKLRMRYDSVLKNSTSEYGVTSIDSIDSLLGQIKIMQNFVRKLGSNETKLLEEVIRLVRTITQKEKSDLIIIDSYCKQTSDLPKIISEQELGEVVNQTAYFTQVARGWGASELTSWIEKIAKQYVTLRSSEQYLKVGDLYVEKSQLQSTFEKLSTKSKKFRELLLFMDVAANLDSLVSLTGRGQLSKDQADFVLHNYFTKRTSFGSVKLSDIIYDPNQQQNVAKLLNMKKEALEKKAAKFFDDKNIGEIFFRHLIKGESKELEKYCDTFLANSANLVMERSSQYIKQPLSVLYKPEFKSFYDFMDKYAPVLCYGLATAGAMASSLWPISAGVRGWQNLDKRYNDLWFPVFDYGVLLLFTGLGIVVVGGLGALAGYGLGAGISKLSVPVVDAYRSTKCGTINYLNRRKIQKVNPDNINMQNR